MEHIDYFMGDAGAEKSCNQSPLIEQHHRPRPRTFSEDEDVGCRVVTFVLLCWHCSLLCVPLSVLQDDDDAGSYVNTRDRYDGYGGEAHSHRGHLGYK